MKYLNISFRAYSAIYTIKTLPKTLHIGKLGPSNRILMEPPRKHRLVYIIYDLKTKSLHVSWFQQSSIRDPRPKVPSSFAFRLSFVSPVLGFKSVNFNGCF